VRRALALLALIAGGALGACGGSGSSATSSSSPPTVTATTAKTLTTPLKIATNPTPTPTTPTVTATTPAKTPTTTSPETQTGGAGDEQPIEIPAAYTLSAGGFKPSTVSVPAFLTIRLSVTAADGRAHTVTVASRTLHVSAGGAAVLLKGVKKGTYDVVADGGAAKAKLIVGVEPGP
jgi:hypothetical protein